MKQLLLADLKITGIAKKTCISDDIYAHLSALYTHCKDSKYLWNRNQEMGKEKEVKEEKRAFIAGVRQKLELKAQRLHRKRNNQEAPLRPF